MKDIDKLEKFREIVMNNEHADFNTKSTASTMVDAIKSLLDSYKNYGGEGFLFAISGYCSAFSQFVLFLEGTGIFGTNLLNLTISDAFEMAEEYAKGGEKNA